MSSYTFEKPSTEFHISHLGHEASNWVLRDKIEENEKIFINYYLVHGESTHFYYFVKN
jgi:hypothetical protein